MKTAQFILEQMVLVKVEANIYGARKKLKKEDLMLADGTKLPPEDLASLGSKRLLDPDKLSVFNRLKKEAERICLRIGTRFLGGYAIPGDSATDIIAELERIALDFTAAKMEFLAGYDAAVSDWVVRHPEFADIIEKAVDSVEFVSTRLSFDYLMVTVGLPAALPAADIVRLETKIGSLSEQMFYEIAVDAHLFIEQSLIGKDQVTRNALRPIKRMRDKLDGLGFLDYRVAPVVSTIDDLLSRIPSKGAIEGSILQEIFATAMLLADPVKTRQHGQGLLAAQGMSKADVVDADDDEMDEISVTQQAFIGSDDELQNPSNNDHGSIQFPVHSADLFDGIFDDAVDLEDTVEDKSTDVTIALAMTEEETETTADNDYWL